MTKTNIDLDVIFDKGQQYDGLIDEVYTKKYIDGVNPKKTQMHWHCGYVKLNKNHSLVSLYNYMDNWGRCYTIDKTISVHGGITYDSLDDEGNLTLGFDLRHHGDDKLIDQEGFVKEETTLFAIDLLEEHVKKSVRHQLISDKYDKITELTEEIHKLNQL
jgi:uncharacterized protein YndB with AHSA1/START domain|tara:strand:- start:993 stop:1472 length:480 start_codon:yes stop_codon:yes gene_type:complete